MFNTVSGIDLINSNTFTQAILISQRIITQLKKDHTVTTINISIKTLKESLYRNEERNRLVLEFCRLQFKIKCALGALGAAFQGPPSTSILDIPGRSKARSFGQLSVKSGTLEAPNSPYPRAGRFRRLHREIASKSTSLKSSVFQESTFFAAGIGNLRSLDLLPSSHSFGNSF